MAAAQGAEAGLSNRLEAASVITNNALDIPGHPHQTMESP